MTTIFVMPTWRRARSSILRAAPHARTVARDPGEGPAIRSGGNDLIQTLGARRSSVRTIYEGPLGGVISGWLRVRAVGVCDQRTCIREFRRPCASTRRGERDLEHGLLTKTAIHPSQIGVIRALAVDADELADAPALLSTESRRCSPATDDERTCDASRLGRNHVRRAAGFGIRREG